MGLKKNVVKGWVTSIIGIVTMLLTLILVYRGDMDFVWNGVVGLSIGTVLLLAPKTMERAFSEIVNRAVPKSSSVTDTTTLLD